jgi:SAM-dependent methyltransferase
VGEREQRLVFGEVADDYDEVRADYPVELVDAIFEYGGGVPDRVLEIGAGTGKATAAFRVRGVPVTCVEPDPAMAAVLHSRYPDVPVEPCRFEDWTPPPGGVPVLACAQAWHWMDHERRLQLAHRALAPGGVLALFGHRYGIADPALEHDLNGAYARHAPELLNLPDSGPPPAVHWMALELAGTPLFTDLQTRQFQRVEPYPTQRYRRLLQTFSPYRLLESDRRRVLLHAIGEVVDAHGGVVQHQLDTELVLARRAER